MSDSLFSQSWYRVAEMRPRLRSHVQVHRHCYRGMDWYVLQDNFTGRYHRFSQEAYQIIGLMDGKRTLAQIWEAACARLGDHMPTQDEVIGLIAKLHRSDVLQSDASPDIADLLHRHFREQRSLWLANLRSPMSARFPLFDPERLLACTLPLIRPLLGRVGAMLWLALVSLALVLAGLHWQDLSADVSDRVLSMENLLLIGLVYPVVKTLHEFGHAYAVKRWGGEVHEMGVMLLVFMPMPYVDASASLAFVDKGKRMLVAAAGIMVELLLAALAMLIWVNVQPGVVRALAFNVMLIAGVSTLLFNGNPLLRFDAYYILADFLEIPNLGARGNRYLSYLAQRYLLGVEGLDSPANSAGEAAWMGVYALAAFVYRIFISVRIALFVAGKYFVVGVLLALWSVAGMVVVPVVKIGAFLVHDPRMKRKRLRILTAVGLPLALLTAFVLAVPVPDFTICEGVVWAPDEARIYAGADGFVDTVLAVPGAMVKAGEPLILCHDPELAARVEVYEAELREYQARYRLSVVADRTEADILKDEIARVEAELSRARERQQDLLVRSPGAGRFLLPQAVDLPGRFVRRGTPLGYVADFSLVRVRAVVLQADVHRVRSNTRRVAARLAGRFSEIMPATVVQEVPAATTDLPSLALSLAGGGKVALDPGTPDRPRSFAPLFQFEVQLTGHSPERVEERVYVRFEHDPEPLAFRWYRDIRRLLLNRFDV